MKRTRSRLVSRPIAIVTVAVLSVSAGLTGCHRGTVSGQVIAKVNGDDITDTELAQEGKPGPTGWKGTPTLNLAIERKVIAQYGRQQGLDKSPQYVLARRRMEETLLAKQVMATIEQKVATPYPADVQKYLDNHPDVSSQRRRIVTDQIEFPVPDGQDELYNQTSLPALINLLTTKRIAARRSREVIDTAMVPTSTTKALDAMTVGSLRAIRNGKMVAYISVLAEMPVPTSSEDGTKLAEAALLRDRRTDELQSFVHNMMSQAKIVYRSSDTKAHNL